MSWFIGYSQYSTYIHALHAFFACTTWQRRFENGAFFVEIVVTPVKSGSKKCPRSNQAQKPTLNRQKQRKVTCVILRRHVGVLYTHIARSIHRFVPNRGDWAGN